MHIFVDKETLIITIHFSCSCVINIERKVSDTKKIEMYSDTQTLNNYYNYFKINVLFVHLIIILFTIITCFAYKSFVMQWMVYLICDPSCTIYLFTIYSQDIENLTSNFSSCSQVTWKIIAYVDNQSHMLLDDCFYTIYMECIIRTFSRFFFN